jgi:ribosomal protein S18 acetylase RimI-like enzyme
MKDVMTAMHPITLKQKESIELQTVRLEHAQMRHKFFVELSLAQTGLVHTIEEIDFHTIESEEKIRDFLKNQRGLWLLAINAANQVVGEVDITVNKLSRVRHNGRLSIGVLPPYQRLGLGSALMNEAILWAKAQGLLRIELFLFENNQAARHLYDRFGFVVEGVRRNFFRNATGFENDLLMAKYL